MQCFIVDAFTHQGLTGNPAAVVILPARMNADWMQQVAAEFQQAETAFLYQASAGDSWELRWFTPSTEVDLCGHATLASAHALWRHCGVGEHTLRFSTKSGTLEARRQLSAAGPEQIALDFPTGSLNPVEVAAASRDQLGLGTAECLQAGPDLLAILPERALIRDFQVDLQAIQSLPWRGLIVSARNQQGEVDFVSRFFAPKLGVPEDPVTGAIHCCLAPFWAERLGKQHLLAEQWSPRGGRLHLHLQGERVQLAGQARTFLTGQLAQQD